MKIFMVNVFSHRSWMGYVSATHIVTAPEAHIAEMVVREATKKMHRYGGRAMVADDDIQTDSIELWRDDSV